MRRELLVREARVERDLFGGFGLDGRCWPPSRSSRRVAAGRGLGAQHHRIGAVEHGVGHIADLGARRTGLTIIDSIICVA